jgi:two-component system, LytTR family, sensor kinase
MPLIAAGLNLILFRGRVWTDSRIWLISMPLIFVLGTLSWYLHEWWNDRSEKRYPSLEQSRQRIIRKIGAMLFLMPPSIMLIFFVYHYFHILGYHWQTMHIVEGLVIGLSVNLVFFPLQEGEYIFSKYKEKRQEQEMLTELSVYQELDTLKNQINPHFLFNCFNTLSSLISVDKKQAELFLNELSKVYRYLLRSNEDGVSTLGNEIKFIQSYFQLLRTRHGEAVKMNLQIEKQYESYLLPSLSLQLLVENAVKHNTLSKSQPLVIDIFTTAGNKLVVNNNLQRRTIMVHSNKVGLENIKSKYTLLRQPGFQVMEDEKNYTVVLPLIWKPQN